MGLHAAPHLTSLDLRGNRIGESSATKHALVASGRANVLFQRRPPLT